MIALIVAMDKNGLIGKNNELPWHYSKDLAYFKKTTKHKKVLMGRKTYDSIVEKLGKALPMRENIVLTRQPLKLKDAYVIHDLPSYLRKIPEEETLFVIGGRTVYEASLPYADRLYITHIDDVFEGDTYFPKVDFSKYRVVRKEENPPLTFAVYERKAR